MDLRQTTTVPLFSSLSISRKSKLWNNSRLSIKNKFKSTNADTIHIFGELSHATAFDASYLYIDYEFSFPKHCKLITHNINHRPPKKYNIQFSTNSENSEIVTDDTQNSSHIPTFTPTNFVTHCTSPFKKYTHPMKNRKLNDSHSGWIPYCCRSNKYENTFNFCTPFEFHIEYDQEKSSDFATADILSNCRILFEVNSMDIWNTHRIEGYSMIDLPTKCGSYKSMCVQCWRPLGDRKQEISRFFIGGGLRLKDKSSLLVSNNRISWNTIPTGYIFLHLEIVRIGCKFASNSKPDHIRSSERMNHGNLSRSQPLKILSSIKSMSDVSAIAKKVRGSGRIRRKKISKLQSILNKKEKSFEIESKVNVGRDRVQQSILLNNVNDAELIVEEEEECENMNVSNDKKSPKKIRRYKKKNRKSKLQSQLNLNWSKS